LDAGGHLQTVGVKIAAKQTHKNPPFFRRTATS
jgi:hypothetical protein